MAVTPRQATQAASQVLHYQATSALAASVSAPERRLTTPAMHGSSMQQPRVAFTIAAHTLPNMPNYAIPRTVTATPIEERVLAELDIFDLQMSGAYLDSPADTAGSRIPSSCGASQQQFAAQLSLDATHREAEALAEEEHYQETLLAAAEEAHLQREQQSWCGQLHYAADLMHDTYKFDSLSTAEICMLQAAAHHLLSVCNDAKDAVQQKELQRMKQELQRLEVLNKVQGQKCAELKECNRAMDQSRAELAKRLESEAEKQCCCICMTTCKNAMLLPCMHMDFCMHCMNKHMEHGSTCPICRVPIRGVLPMHLNQ